MKIILCNVVLGMSDMYKEFLIEKKLGYVNVLWLLKLSCRVLNVLRKSYNIIVLSF